MELTLVIWAVGTLPSVAKGMCFVLFPLMVLVGVAKIVCLVGSKVENCKQGRENLQHFSKVSGRILWFVCPIWFLFVLVPEEDTAYKMLAAYGVQTLVENETAQELASDGVDVLKAMMNKAKKDLEEDVEK